MKKRTSDSIFNASAHAADYYKNKGDDLRGTKYARMSQGRDVGSSIFNAVKKRDVGDGSAFSQRDRVGDEDNFRR